MKVAGKNTVSNKILEVMRRVSYLQKDGQVAFGKTRYKYLSEEKITGAMRSAMIEVGLVMYPSAMQVVNEDSKTITILCTYRIEDTTTGDHIEIQAIGEGMDSGDKTVYKAMTGAFKYAQRQTFMISTGDDPDQICSEELLTKMDKPEPPAKPVQAKEGPQKPTQAQTNTVMELVKDLGLDSGFMGKLIQDELGKDRYGDLDTNEAKQLIELLQGMQQQAAS